MDSDIVNDSFLLSKGTSTNLTWLSISNFEIYMCIFHILWCDMHTFNDGKMVGFERYNLNRIFQISPSHLININGIVKNMKYQKTTKHYTPFD